MKPRAFTLMEILIVLALVAIVAAVAVPATLDAYQGSRAAADLARVELMRKYLEAIYTAPDRFAPPPVTEGGGIPFSGSGFARLSAEDRARLATVSEVLLARRLTDTWPRWATAGRNGRPVGSMTASGPATAAFDAAANAWTGEAAAVSIDRPAALESRASDPTLVPSAAAGANFRLDGAKDLPASRQVFYVYLPDVPIRLARRLVELRDAGFLPAEETSACDGGEVVYPAPVDGETPVFLYVTHH